MIVTQRADGPDDLAPRTRRGPATAEAGVLLVGHGSRSTLGAAQMHRIADLVAAARPGQIVELGFLEMSDPPAGKVLDELVERGCRRIVVLPLLLLGAGHAKSDVPAVVVEARLRHPGVSILYGSPLGVTGDLVAIGGANLAEVGAAGRPLLVVARGTSDPDANAEATRAARLLAEWNRSTVLHVGFTGMTWPSVPDALTQMGALTGEPFAVFFWFLCHGRLIERARAQMADFAAATGRQVLDAGYLGPDPGLVGPVGHRLEEAAAGVAATNCDTCRYRLAFPGHEDEVGRPVGVGHSHLAAEHRGDGHHHHHHHEPGGGQ